MFKALTPIFALIIAIGLGYTHVYPTFLAIKKVQTETNEYQENIRNAEKLKAELAQKIAKRESFPLPQVERLYTMMPDSVDEVSLIIDLDALAGVHRMALSGIAVKKTDAGAGQSPRAVGVGGEASAGSVSAGNTVHKVPIDISFSLEGTYEDFRSFIDELEQSLVFFDVTKLSFTATEGDLFTYALSLRTYSFNSSP